MSSLHGLVRPWCCKNARDLSLSVLWCASQHNDTYIPHYHAGEFTWLRGALSSVDRSYGPVIGRWVSRDGRRAVVCACCHSCLSITARARV